MKSFCNRLILITIAIIIALPACAFAQSQFDFVIVRGDIPVDMLVAQAYTNKIGIPLITVTNNFLINELEDELAGYHEQGYEEALIIGGSGAIPVDIETKLDSMGYSVTRIWDWNRYGTSARVAMTLWDSSETVVVTQGNPGELMLAARTANEYASPLLLTEGDKLSDETKTAIQQLGSTRIILIGDASSEVKKELSALGGLQQTIVRPINRDEPGKSTFFLIGLVIGGLAIFLVSSLWGAMMFRKSRTPELTAEMLEDEEQKILTLVKNGRGNLKQQDIPELTGFSRPKVTREVAELIKKGKIKREKRGKTYILKKV
ncbi:MAG: cell wall-binding repeat-containing protein [archaeon]